MDGYPYGYLCAATIVVPECDDRPTGTTFEISSEVWGPAPLAEDDLMRALAERGAGEVGYDPDRAVFVDFSCTPLPVL